MLKVKDFGKKYTCFAEVISCLSSSVFYSYMFWQIGSVKIHDINYWALAWKLGEHDLTPFMILYVSFGAK